MTGPGASLGLDDVSIRYAARETPALSHLHLAVEPGQFVSAAGRNGAGKSTLALAAAGFIPRVVRAAVDGTITLGGAAISALPDAVLRRTAGIVFATPSNQLSSSKLTVREELAFGLENLGFERSRMDQRIDEVLDRLHIVTLADRDPLALSGGEQQRVAIASIVAMGTAVLVLDEPTGQLDPAGTAGVTQLLAELARAGTTVLCTEHDPMVIAASGRCLLLDGGRAVALDRPGRAMSSAALRPLGLPPPTAILLAEAAGVEADDAFDDDRIVEALSSPAGALRATAALGTGRSMPDAGGELDPLDLGASGRPPVTIDVQGLRHSYAGGVEAVRGVDLRLEPGEAAAIVGQNGSGKTTLVKHLNGLLRPTAGELRIDGRPTADRPIHELAADVGFVFQNPDDQLFDRSVEREVSFGPRNLGFGAERLARQVELALRAVQLTDVRASNPYDLTTSDRKLVSLASVLAMDPAVLVLDEPTTGQDGPGVLRVGQVVRAFRASGRTVVAITHDMEFAATHFDRIVVMRDGEVVADGRPDQVFGPEGTGVLHSTGLEAPVAARIGARLGLGSTPTLESLVDALGTRG